VFGKHTSRARQSSACIAQARQALEREIESDNWSAAVLHKIPAD